MASSKKSAHRPPPLRPDHVLRRFSSNDRKADPWPAWCLVRWEDSFLLKRWIRQLWDVLSSKDPSAEKIVLHPRDPASVETLFQEITSPSLFSATRLVVANAVRPIKRTIPPISSISTPYAARHWASINSLSNPAITASATCASGCRPELMPRTRS